MKNGGICLRFLISGVPWSYHHTSTSPVPNQDLQVSVAGLVFNTSVKPEFPSQKNNGEELDRGVVPLRSDTTAHNQFQPSSHQNNNNVKSSVKNKTTNTFKQVSSNSKTFMLS